MNPSGEVKKSCMEAASVSLQMSLARVMFWMNRGPSALPVLLSGSDDVRERLAESRGHDSIIRFQVLFLRSESK